MSRRPCQHAAVAVRDMSNDLDAVKARKVGIELSPTMALQSHCLAGLPA